MNQSGQAVFEFIIVLVIALTLTTKMISSSSEFLGGVFGNLNHYLSLNLNTGLCKSECFFSKYQNGYGE